MKHSSNARQLLQREEAAVIAVAIKRIMANSRPPEPGQPWMIELGQIVRQIHSADFSDRMIGRRARTMPFGFRLSAIGRRVLLVPQGWKFSEFIPWNEDRGTAWSETLEQGLFSEAMALLEERWQEVRPRPAVLAEDPKIQALKQELLEKLTPQEREDYLKNISTRSMEYFGRAMGEDQDV